MTDLPPHGLKLKNSMTIILMRGLAISEGIGIKKSVSRR